jgi:hypothetical protein
MTFHRFKLSDVSRVLGRKEIRKDREGGCEYDEPEGSLGRKVWEIDGLVSHMRGVGQDSCKISHYGTIIAFWNLGCLTLALAAVLEPCRHDFGFRD